jgi:hypothetical protein
MPAQTDKDEAAREMLAALWNTLSFAQLAYGKLAPHYQGEMSGFDGMQEIARAAIAQAEAAGIKAGN